ncbi:MAG: Holliday junction resolvase RuvX [Myxococcales bacterium]|nr:Holliday junction resolvase RuvX [Myxococcales bacterium]MBL0193676.1 Holliday junction resolvase RuvX [Myxococcales bacterium]
MHKARGARACALDLGGARVGVALADELGLYAHPRGVLAARPRPALLASIAAFAREERVTHIVCGLPLDMRGGEGDAANKARDLAQEIADSTGLSVELWDERLTTVEARRNLAASEVHGAKAKARIDEASAVTILQAWLDQRRHAPRSRGRR